MIPAQPQPIPPVVAPAATNPEKLSYTISVDRATLDRTHPEGAGIPAWVTKYGATVCAALAALAAAASVGVASCAASNAATANDTAAKANEHATTAAKDATHWNACLRSVELARDTMRTDEENRRKDAELCGQLESALMDLDTSIHLVSKSDAENNAAKGAAFRVFFSSVARAEPWLKADDPAGKKAALSTQLTALREMISIDAAADGNQPSRGHQNDAWKACFVAKEPKCAKYAPTKDDKPSSTTISAEDIAAGYSSFETSILSTESTVAASCYEQIKLPPTPDACRDVAELGKPGDPVKTNADKKDAGDPVKTNADRKDAGDPVKTNADRKDADN